MRTVHETEALRPSDPVPKHHSSNPQNKIQRLRLTFKFSAITGTNGRIEDEGNSPVSSKAGPTLPISPSTVQTQSAEDIEYEQNNCTFTRHPTTNDWIAHYPPDINFTEQELALPQNQLLILLHKQIKWASDGAEKLKTEVHKLEKYRQSEWIAKEALLREYLKTQRAIVEEQEAEAAAIEKSVEDFDEMDLKEEPVVHGDIPPYPYAAPDDHESVGMNGDA
jgi:hypothetical protein